MWQLQDRYGKKKQLFHVFINLEKTFEKGAISALKVNGMMYVDICKYNTPYNKGLKHLWSFVFTRGSGTNIQQMMRADSMHMYTEYKLLRLWKIIYLQSDLDRLLSDFEFFGCSWTHLGHEQTGMKVQAFHISMIGCDCLYFGGCFCCLVYLNSCHFHSLMWRNDFCLQQNIENNVV